MIYNNSYVLKKEVDWSMLHQGVNIPVTIQVVFRDVISRFLPRGQSKDIYLVLDGEKYKAKLVNRKGLVFVYNNGVEERIVLNRHF